jgi:hypothetical protein
LQHHRCKIGWCWNKEMLLSCFLRLHKRYKNTYTTSLPNKPSVDSSQNAIQETWPLLHTKDNTWRYEMNIYSHTILRDIKLCCSTQFFLSPNGFVEVFVSCLPFIAESSNVKNLNNKCYGLGTIGLCFIHMKGSTKHQPCIFNV